MWSHRTRLSTLTSATILIAIHRFNTVLGMIVLSVNSGFRVCQGLGRKKTAPSSHGRMADEDPSYT